ncbi:MAG: FG-GAP-like repeat-containing protein [Verrucomicrobiales bacterium]|nr:FG-GAP-like repeat-containing protein [Verrucomicrobiales bacterium]
MKSLKYFLVSLLCSAYAFELSAQEKNLQAFPLKKAPTEFAGVRFELLSPEKTGVTHVNLIDTKHPMKRVYHSSSACGGVAIGDLDLDGKTDFFAANGPRNNSLYLQTGELVFDNVAEALGVTGGDEAWGVGVSLVDIDNDGDLDIYVVNYDYPNQLFINQLIGKDGKRSKKGLSFIERAKDFGLNAVDGSIEGAFCDFDRDGDLDMYLLTHQVYRDGGRPEDPVPLIKMPDGKPEVNEEWQRWYRVDHQEHGPNGEVMYVERGRPDRLYRNDGGKFVEITEAAGISTGPRWGNSVTWWDYNQDGWPDIYVGNDFSDPDYLYRNNGDGTFTESARPTLRHTTWFSMGAAQTDLNNDGLIDFLVADMMPSTHYMQKASMASMGSRLKRLLAVPGARQLMRNALHLNTGTDYMMEAGYLSGVAQTEWTWAIRSADFDNDGDADLFFTNGIPRQFNHSDVAPSFNHAMLVGKNKWDYYEKTSERREQNMAYQNNGGLQFTNVSKQWGLDHVSMSYGASIGDLNGDGWPDLVVSNLEDPLSLYLNKGGKGSRVVLDLRGKESNSQGIGALVTLETAGGKRQVRHLLPTGGFMDGDQAQVHFGLGQQKKILRLRIDWPSGRVQEFKGLAADQRYVITEPSDGKAIKKPAVKKLGLKSPMFVESSALKGFGVKEKPFDDYARQSLLPLGLSQLGPGQAWADVDGDGDDDFYLGGSSGQAGRLFINQTESGSNQPLLVPRPVVVFGEDAAYEDMGMLFFDVDGDGDLDLYVVSGSIECEPGDEILQDRLYLNDGKGDFVKAATGAVPSIRRSGSVVVGADFDRDGDVDLFVGSRSVPGAYPVVPTSTLLVNEGGKLVEATAQVSAKLAKTGLVTGALWSDVDSDGWIDLVVTHDWGLVKIYRNHHGKLKDETAQRGIGKEFGWWNGIAARDIDNDGDVDFVATNFGLNTQYKASLTSPELIFYGDFDKTGKAHILEANFEGDVCFPRRGFSCTSLAMPMIGDKMQTYSNFASASLSQIIPIDRLSDGIRHRANILESSAFINDGEGNFSVVKLPHLSQASPGFGVVLSDVDLDGKVDCYMVQNFFNPQVETGPFDSGVSLLLRGTGDAKKPFEAVWPAMSGLLVPGDAKSLAAVDLNRDGREDFIVGVNNADPQVFMNAVPLKDTHPLRIQLIGAKGNPQALGARVTVKAPGLKSQMAEIYGGGSYLTQSSDDLIFAVPQKVAEGSAVLLEIRWPDGGVTSTQCDASAQSLSIKRK